MFTNQPDKDTLLAEKAMLCEEKHRLQDKLAGVKDLVRSSGRMPNDKYRQCCESHREYVRQLSALETRLIANKSALRQIANQEGKVQQQGAQVEEAPIATASLISTLSELRQHYREFSADVTRVSSLRSMAADFALKLDKIIRDAINPPA